jgi:hypothetical protein
MTIAIAASGSRAGQAVCDALLGAELLGRGAIGGFAVLAMLDDDGQLHQCSSQRGGVSTLDVPGAWLAARVAAAISSGPDRPEPLVQFLPGAARVGLVTGHRLPNRPGRDGGALNKAVLSLLARGIEPKTAVESVLADNPEADAGLIAINGRGEVGWGNSERVARRTDLGQFERQDGSSHIAILHNAIHAREPLAAQVGALAWAQLADRPGSVGWVRLTEAVPRRRAAQDRLHIDASGRITAIDCADPFVPEGPLRMTVVHLDCAVWQHGACVGRALTELFADVGDDLARPWGNAIHHTLLVRTNHVAS